MRYLTNIEVTSLIVHVIDTKSTTGLLLSSRTVAITPNDRVALYFANHIKNSVKDGRGIAAVFNNVAPGDVSWTCSSLIDQSIDLVTGSHDLAQRLFTIMSRDKRIASGDLAVCSFTAENGSQAPQASSYVGILKLDPSLALWHKTEYDDDGRPYVRFEVADNVLPTVNEKLQKCAFIQSLTPRGQFDLLVLDDQIGARPGESVARFFLQQFLNARPAMDSAQCTHALLTALRQGERAIRKLLTDDQRQDFGLHRQAVVRSAHVDLDHWISSLPIPDSAKEKLDEALRHELPNRTFDIDHRVVNTEMPKRRFRGSNGLRVDIPDDLFSTIYRGAEEQFDEHGNRYYRVTLHTDSWEEITKG